MSIDFEKWQGRWTALREWAVNGRKPQPICVEEAECHVCKNCGTAYRGNYCPGCGQTCKTQRLTTRHAIEHMFNALVSADRGFLHTCTDLVLRPGHMMRDYIEGHRIHYISPISLLFVLSTIYVAVRFLIFQHVEHFQSDIDEGMYQALGGEGSFDVAGMVTFLTQGINMILDNRALTSLYVCLVSAGPFWLVFHKLNPSGQPMNVCELFYISCYISCQQLMWLIICLPWDRIQNDQTSLSLGLPFLFTIWDMHQYFRLPLRRTVRRCIIAYALSLVLGLVLIIGILTLAALGWLAWSKL